jgi:hypothetical protein
LKGVKNLKVGDNNGFVSFGKHLIIWFILRFWKITTGDSTKYRS